MINNKFHGILDYLTVIAFAMIPTFFGLTGLQANLCYGLAAVHFVMTVLTNFEMGVVKVLPLKFHKIVEQLVGPLLMVSPWILGFSNHHHARWIFSGAGFVINLIGWLSRYTMI